MHDCSCRAWNRGGCRLSARLQSLTFVREVQMRQSKNVRAVGCLYLLRFGSPSCVKYDKWIGRAQLESTELLVKHHTAGSGPIMAVMSLQ